MDAALLNLRVTVVLIGKVMLTFVLQLQSTGCMVPGSGGGVDTDVPFTVTTGSKVHDGILNDRVIP